MRQGKREHQHDRPHVGSGAFRIAVFPCCGSDDSYICKSDQELFKDIAPYIHSLVYNLENTTAAYGKQAFNWLCEHYYDLKPEEIDPRIAQLVDALNKHLENRLNEHEC